MALHGNDTNFVDRVIAKKEKEGLYQDHPEAEGVKMYYVFRHYLHCITKQCQTSQVNQAVESSNQLIKKTV